MNNVLLFQNIHIFYVIYRKLTDLIKDDCDDSHVGHSCTGILILDSVTIRLDFEHRRSTDFNKVESFY
jgi:hypothetical protein